MARRITLANVDRAREIIATLNVRKVVSRKQKILTPPKRKTPYWDGLMGLCIHEAKDADD
jgi:hypothetical protein